MRAGVPCPLSALRQERRAPRVLAAAILALAGLLAAVEPAGACAVCYGAADAPLTHGMNNAILTLLGVVGLVQVSFAALFWSFWRQSRRLREDRRRFDLIEGGAK